MRVCGKINIGLNYDFLEKEKEAKIKFEALNLKKQISNIYNVAIGKANEDCIIELEKAIDLLVKLSEYVIPKLNRTEIKDVTSIDDLLQLTPQERQARILTLKNKIENE